MFAEIAAGEMINDARDHRQNWPETSISRISAG
jgi:hypothetical protein